MSLSAPLELLRLLYLLTSLFTGAPVPETVNPLETTPTMNRLLVAGDEAAVFAIAGGLTAFERRLALANLAIMQNYVVLSVLTGDASGAEAVARRRLFLVDIELLRQYFLARSVAEGVDPRRLALLGDPRILLPILAAISETEKRAALANLALAQQAMVVNLLAGTPAGRDAPIRLINVAVLRRALLVSFLDQALARIEGKGGDRY